MLQCLGDVMKNSSDFGLGLLFFEFVFSDLESGFLKIHLNSHPMYIFRLPISFPKYIGVRRQGKLLPAFVLLFLLLIRLLGDTCGMDNKRRRRKRERKRERKKREKEREKREEEDRNDLRMMLMELHAAANRTEAQI